MTIISHNVSVEVKHQIQAAIIDWARQNPARFALATKIEMANVIIDHESISEFFTKLIDEFSLVTKEGPVKVKSVDVRNGEVVVVIRFADHRAVMAVEKYNGQLMADAYTWSGTTIAKNMKKAVNFGFGDSDEARARTEAFIATLATEYDRQLATDFFKGLPIKFKFVVTPEENRIVIPVTQELVDEFGYFVVNSWQNADDDGMYQTCPISIGDQLVVEISDDGASYYVLEKGMVATQHKDRDGDVVAELVAKGLLK